MFGIILIVCVLTLGYYWFFSGKKERSDILETASMELEDAKAARKAAQIHAETKKVLAETNEINKQKEID